VEGSQKQVEGSLVAICFADNYAAGFWSWDWSRMGRSTDHHWRHNVCLDRSYTSGVEGHLLPARETLLRKVAASRYGSELASDYNLLREWHPEELAWAYWCTAQCAKLRCNHMFTIEVDILTLSQRVFFHRPLWYIPSTELQN
jgi:hypothetical protein